MLKIMTPKGDLHCEVANLNDFENEIEYIKQQGLDPAGFHIEKSSLFLYESNMKKQEIDRSLHQEGMDEREQLVTVANGLQIALFGLSSLVVACSKSKDSVLVEASEDLLPLAEKFINAKSSGNMPIDILGINSVSEKIIKNTIKTGEVLDNVIRKNSEKD